MRVTAALPRAVLRGSLAHDRLRTALAIGAIALGVALGFAVQTINGAAVNELALGVQSLSGDADLELRGPRAGFDEALYPRVAQWPEVAIASPVVEVDAKLATGEDSLRVLGLDLFRAAAIQPALVPEVRDRLDVLRGDVLFPSAAAVRDLHLDTGGTLTVQAGLRRETLRVGGTLGPAITPPMAMMDIAAAQQRFDRIGVLTRIDLRLRPGTDIAAFTRRVAPELPAGLALVRPDTTVAAGASASRAYRVNLQVLALVALFTGGLLVFSTQALSVVRRRAQFALLRVLGVTRRQLVTTLVTEGALLGMIGSVAGIAAGYVLARVALRSVGADLGSGYFRGVAPSVVFDPWLALVFLVIGVVMAAAGSAVPAREAARAAPAPALKAGDEQRAFAPLGPWRPGVLILFAGALCAFAPPVAGLPLFGYFSIALMLIGTLMLLPRMATLAWQSMPQPRAASASLALTQLRGAPGQATVSLASIVASVSLMVSMGIMVHSFRGSLEAWLEQVLPADLYLRAGPVGDSAYVPPELQARIRALPGVRRVDFIREQQVLLDPQRPRVVVIAREIEPDAPQRTLPIIASAPHASDLPPVWVNEPAAAIYGYTAGESIAIPLGGRAVRFAVAGIWRDYARQQGALVIERSQLIALTGDRTATNAALWVQPGADAFAVRDAIVREIGGGDRLDIGVPADIRRASLRAFDRTFAVTYALELAAVAIGLVGLSSSFGALVLTRRREFGMLRHIGMTRRQIAAMLATEGLFVSGVGMLAGVGLGWLMSLVLIHVVNRQSFHWGMELSIPWLALLAGVALVLLLSMGTAVVSGRAAMGSDAVRAVREDW